MVGDKMKFIQHIDIGKYILDNNIIDNCKIDRKAFLFGCIAPDINVVYPAHRLKTTENRFYKKLVIVDIIRNNIIKSYYLGTITHYICDYFCYAHETESIGIKHKKYENNLYKYYESHIKELEKSNTLLNIWNRNKIKSNKISIHEHCDYVMEQLKIMNKTYFDELKLRDNTNWQFNNDIIKNDLRYVQFMLENMLGIITQPIKCTI